MPSSARGPVIIGRCLETKDGFKYTDDSNSITGSEVVINRFKENTLLTANRDPLSFTQTSQLADALANFDHKAVLPSVTVTRVQE